MKFIDLVQGSSEWHEFRSNHLGASDIPVIIGVSPWKKPIDLWNDKLGLTKSIPNEWMRRGTEMEIEARQQFILETEIWIYPKVVQHDSIEYAIASLDGISEDEKTLVEIKCPGKKDHTIAEKGEIPEKYYPQLQWQMFVTGIEEMQYVSYRYNDLVIVDLSYNPKYIEEILPKIENFYFCMVGGIPPSN